MTDIDPRILRWFATRGIEETTVRHIGVYSGRRLQAGEVVPDPDGDVIVFPSFRSGVIVNEKYRAAGKRIWQKTGGLKTFYNADVLSDPRLQDGTEPLVITEGEIDCHTALQCGFPCTVSVPDGAPPELKDPISIVPEPDPETDVKYAYVLRDWERLKGIPRIIIAADGDGPGQRLAEELVRRLGRVRCYWVEYPEGCKDLNDVLMAFGPDEVCAVLQSAKPYPVNGLYALSEFPPEPALTPLSTGFGRLDDLLMVYYPALMTVTGFAGAGKTTFANQMFGYLAREHGWKSAIASFEMRLDPVVTNTLRAVYLDKPIERWSVEDIQRANDWIEENFRFITASDDSEDQHDIDWLLERAEAAVIRHGIRALLIDPWNEIEHSRRRGESVTDYVGRALQSVKRFGRRFDCFICIVAHPTKNGAQKKSEDLSLYDVSDSAHFANKSDLGVVMNRIVDSELTQVLVRKVRYQPETGRRGMAEFMFANDLKLFAG